MIPFYLPICVQPEVGTVQSLSLGASLTLVYMERCGEIFSSAFTEEESKGGRWIQCWLVIDEDNHLHAFLSPDSHTSLLVVL